jgi:ubiquinol-cytochrome c reductase cytochrome b subunit
MNRIGALVPTVKGFFFPIEEPARSPRPEAPVSPAPTREEITSGQR